MRMRICKWCQAVSEGSECEYFPVRQAPSTADNQSRSMERDFHFVERPSQDFFCPVSLELLLEPQLTSCCGHHLSLEAATRLQREGKPCPMCNGEQWSAVLDKYHRRKVQEVRVCCWYKDNGCEWVGEVNELKRHADSCVKRPWECKYCALKCTYGEGEGRHWPTCLEFPEPCPNGCEVGSVERCNVEQHRSVCSLEPVACEMKEFGCSVVVPRKELATHMRESELQHLTAMTVLNLRLSRQLQQDSTERDRKIAQLQQEMTKLQTDMQAEMKMKMDELQTGLIIAMDEQKQSQAESSKKIALLQSEMTTKSEEQKQGFDTVGRQLHQDSTERDGKIAQLQQMTQMFIQMQAEITQLQSEMKAKIEEQEEVLAIVNCNVTEQKAHISELKGCFQEAQRNTPCNEEHTASGGTEVAFTFTQYSWYKGRYLGVFSDPFYSHHCGYKFKLKLDYYSSPNNTIGAELYLMKGEYDHLLLWPVEVKVRLELLNQLGDHHHVVRTKNIRWTKHQKERAEVIDLNIIKYSTLEKQGGGVQYVVYDCLKFRIIV